MSAALHNAVTTKKPLCSIEVSKTIAHLSQGFGELMSLLPAAAESPGNAKTTPESSPVTLVMGSYQAYEDSSWCFELSL